MENIFKYFEFSTFKRDESSTFNTNEIAFSELNSTHFLIFEKNQNQYHLYVSRFASKKDIGVNKPEILELLVKNYDKSIPEHRIALKQYFN